MSVREISLDDKYSLTSGRAYLSGIQALVCLPLLQRRRDAAAGLNTRGFISGYRGSPLGGYDNALISAQRHLDAAGIVFQAGLNEDLAMTAVWGSQQVGLFPGAKTDGIFGIWYGKAPGVDRSMDALKHANMAGTSPLGGVLAFAGDDHACSSSTLPSQSEQLFEAAMLPVINPATLQDYLDFGIFGIALSRFSGAWVGFKTISETVESSGSVDIAADRVTLVQPDFDMPSGGLNIRWPDPPVEQERRLHGRKMAAIAAFAQANSIDRVVIDTHVPHLGILTTGKAYLDVMEALRCLGISAAEASALGIRVYKLGLTWPIERVGVLRFAEGLREILVVEEKRGFIEGQLVQLLYNQPAVRRPIVTGKRSDSGERLLPSEGMFSPTSVARAIVSRLSRLRELRPEIYERLEHMATFERIDRLTLPSVERTPFFCSGCPHNSSTKVPEGSRALGGIGCHALALFMPRRDTATGTHMGAEGTNWIGQAPFTNEPHIFQNLGDGTYSHSGLLAIRAAAVAGVNITYKILFNDAVAMTGGQPVEGALTVDQITHQVIAEGAKRTVVVADDPTKYPPGVKFADGVTIRPREDLDQVQRELREVKGLSVLIYDQTCAAEKRRRRKRGKLVDPDRRIFINSAVCEGCGDCSVKSNCISVRPIETELGRKREIDQSTCNKDYSCADGFCPSFVSILGGSVRKPDKATFAGEAALFAAMPWPPVTALEADRPYGILVTGVGGTGVLTIGALIGMAAHMDGIRCSVLDNTGSAQKNGAVTSHLRLSRTDLPETAVRIPAGETDVLLACDMMVATAASSLSTLTKGRTIGIVNRRVQPMGSYVQNPDIDFQLPFMERALHAALGGEALEFVDGSGIAEALTGDTIATNIFMLGYAWQKGGIPLSLDALTRAIEINNVAVTANLRAFNWGRLIAHDPGQAAARLTLRSGETKAPLDDPFAVRDDRSALLVRYQNEEYAARYRSLVNEVIAAEKAQLGAAGALSLAVARNLYKVMAYKDEYEVARLYANPDFLEVVRRQFSGDFRMRFHLASPIFAPRDPVTGHLRKRSFGGWMMPIFRLLARMKGLRGTPLDPFGHTAERRAERAFRDRYAEDVRWLTSLLTAERIEAAISLASLPERVRGYGHVKEAAMELADHDRNDLRRAVAQPSLVVAAE